MLSQPIKPVKVGNLSKAGFGVVRVKCYMFYGPGRERRILDLWRVY